MTTRIAQTFQKLREQNHMAFMPFVTAGDPSLEVTAKLIQTLHHNGVDLIEIGFPYSDPIADGPVIQSSYTRVLNKGTKVDEIFAMIASLDTDTLPPLVAMVSYAIILRTGVDVFLTKCKDAGVSGLIVPDLPADEAAELKTSVLSFDLDLVQLLAPTSTAERTRTIVDSATGFVYCIAVAGTTGEREHLATELVEQLMSVREMTDLPLAVGFGISRPEHISPLRGAADGAIVGSGIVRQIEPLAESPGDVDRVLGEIGEYVATMVAEAHRS